MIVPRKALLALGFALSVAAFAKEAPGIAAGTAAPALEGDAWVSADGQAPAVQDKVYLVDFYFQG